MKQRWSMRDELTELAYPFTLLRATFGSAARTIIRLARPRR
jgi:hypothetical protein